MIVKQKYSRIIMFLLLLLSLNVLYAQSKKSIYSIFGIGQIVDKSFGVNRSMGGTGIAFQSGNTMNYSNPASYNGLDPKSFNMEFGVYGIYQQSSNKNTVQSFNDINFSYFSINSYFSDKWSISLGIVPFSNIDYNISTTESVEGELTSIDKYYKGSGGLKRAYLGNTYLLKDNLTIGINSSIIFGSVSQIEKIINDEGLTEYEFTRENFINGLYFDFGFQYIIQHEEYQYILGMIYGFKTRLSSRETLEFLHNEETTELENDNKEYYSIPEKFGIGFSLKSKNDFRAGFDYEFKNWSATGLSGSGNIIRNSNRFSLGGEYRPDPRGDFFYRLFYRAGAFYNSTYLKIKETPIDLKGVTAGLGIPIGEKNSINISVEYGEEGTFNNGLIKDRYIQLYLNFSFHDFLASEYDD